MNKLREYTMKLRLIIGVASTLMLFACNDNRPATNWIKSGTAEISITVTGDAFENIVGQIIATPLFEMEPHVYPIVQNGNSFSCSVPTVTEKMNAALMLYVEEPPTPLAFGVVELLQSEPLKINVDIVSKDSVVSSLSNSSGMNSIGLTADAEAYSRMMPEMEMRFAYGPADEFKPFRSISSKEYMSWENVKDIYDSLYTAHYDFAINGNSLPDVAAEMLDNEFKMFFAANYFLNYHDRARREAEMDRLPEYPDEFYSFLNEIDYANILDHGPAISPIYFLQKILSDLPVWIEPVGETPLKQWKTDTKKRLGRIIKSPSPIFIDLLSAVSYLQQINENELLTETQIANINAGYESDLGKIILARNSEVAERLAQSANLYDYSDKKFDLDEFIAENYAGRPVIIDFWNTWCGPCMAAHKEVDKIKETGEYDGVVFLYLSNTSSGEKEWKKHAPLIGGEQVRLSDEDWGNLCGRFGIDGIPYYVVMDKNHKTIDRRVGFPGPEGYSEWLNSIK